MNDHFREIIKQSTKSTDIYEIEVIQNLWSGYGKIIRFGLEGGNYESLVVKHVRTPDTSKHPRGWNTDLSHQRKVHSYEVETSFYQQWSNRCDDFCRIPRCLAVEKLNGEVLIVLEDLDSSGFSGRKTSITIENMFACLKWLANFHVSYMHQAPTNLWRVGTYWHLNTRPDELEALDDIALKNAAKNIDKLLNNSPFLTFVHGDAKLANFCFGDNGKVAAVDFQYVGGGCGMKDVAYFIGSCLYEEDCENYEADLLNKYFTYLKEAIISKNSGIDYSALEENWRKLFPLAWTDFHRFIKGWSPGHWKINSYSERMARDVISHL